MALQNEVLGTAARFGQFLWRRFNLVNGNPSPQITPEITPVMPFITDQSDLYILGETIWSRITGIPPDATHVAQWQLGNPANSGVIAVISQVTVLNREAAASVLFGFFVGAYAGVDYNTVVAPLARDCRQGVALSGNPRSSAMKLTVQNNVAAAGAGDYFNAGTNLAAGQTYTDQQGFVLPPGSSLIMLSNDANRSVAVGAWWKERPMTPLEVGF